MEGDLWPLFHFQDREPSPLSPWMCMVTAHAKPLNCWLLRIYFLTIEKLWSILGEARGCRGVNRLVGSWWLGNHSSGSGGDITVECPCQEIAIAVHSFAIPALAPHNFDNPSSLPESSVFSSSNWLEGLRCEENMMKAYKVKQEKTRANTGGVMDMNCALRVERRRREKSGGMKVSITRSTNGAKMSLHLS